jgi:hypothetical protein
MAASVKIAALPKFWCRAHERMLRKQSEKNEGLQCPAMQSSGHPEMLRRVSKSASGNLIGSISGLPKV